MKRVKWWAAKIWRGDIELWEDFKSKSEALSFLRYQEELGDNPFSLVKVTTEVVPYQRKAKK